MFDNAPAGTIRPARVFYQKREPPEKRNAWT